MTGKVLSGVIASNANFEGAKVVRNEMSRAQAIDANFKNADFSDTNAYEAGFFCLLVLYSHAYHVIST